MCQTPMVFNGTAICLWCQPSWLCNHNPVAVVLKTLHLFGVLDYWRNTRVQFVHQVTDKNQVTKGLWDGYILCLHVLLGQFQFVPCYIKWHGTQHIGWCIWFWISHLQNYLSSKIQATRKISISEALQCSCLIRGENKSLVICTQNV